MTEPAATTQSPDPKTLVAELDQLLDRIGTWACLVGPQKAGKSTYAQYLLNDPHLVAPHAWSIAPLMKHASGELRIEQVAAAPSLRCLEPQTRPAPAPGGNFYMAEPTKDILHFQAFREPAGARHRVATRLPVHFFDLPGEWPRPMGAHAREREAWQRAPMARLLERTERFVLFVPFWSLLPTRWYEAQQLGLAAEPALWGTSLAVSADSSSYRIDADAIVHAARLSSQDVALWVDRIQEHRRRPFDVLIVLNQFQEAPVRALLNRLQTGRGDRLWEDYHQVFTTHSGNGERSDAWRILRQRLEQLRHIGLELFADLDRAGGGGSLGLNALNRLIKFQAHAESARDEGTRRRARTVTILPLNVVALDVERPTTWQGKTMSTYDLFSQPSGGSPPELCDFRLCADVVWWIMLQIKADRIWMA